MIITKSLELVAVKRKALGDYRRIVGDQVIDEISNLAHKLKGARILQINSSSFGGGVAELLNSLVPLEEDCGLKVEWRLLCQDERLFKVTKEFHNALQGKEMALTNEMKDIYLQRNRDCADLLENRYDIIFVHEPQPAALAQLVSFPGVKWVWRCHIDTSSPNQAVWGFLRPFIQSYHVNVFTMQKFVPSGLIGPRMEFITPAIDPLSAKTRALPKYLYREQVSEFGIDLARPFILQVSRFDPWKDPEGVVAVYRTLKREFPELQLALEAWVTSPTRD